jgi:hypothetical protein
MKKKVKSYKDFLNENTMEPDVKPITKPKTAPVTKPGRPNPFRKDKPSVIPKPKASVEDVVNKFLNMTKDNKEIKNLLKNKYGKKINEKLIDSSEGKRRSIDLRGPEGNGYVILGIAKNFTEQLKKVDPEKYEWEKIQSEMTNGDYKNLVLTFERYFGDFVDIYNADVLDDY